MIVIVTMWPCDFQLLCLIFECDYLPCGCELFIVVYVLCTMWLRFWTCDCQLWWLNKFFYHVIVIFYHVVVRFLLWSLYHVVIVQLLWLWCLNCDHCTGWLWCFHWCWRALKDLKTQISWKIENKSISTFLLILSQYISNQSMLSIFPWKFCWSPISVCVYSIL